MRHLFTFLLAFATLEAPAQFSIKKHEVKPNTANRSSEPWGFIPFKGKTYFFANDSTHGRELWWSDGDTFGMAADIFPGHEPSAEAAERMCIAANKLYFRARNQYAAVELWQYDGVNPPSLALDLGKNSPIPYDTDPRQLTTVKDKVYFTGYTEGDGRNIWMYDPVSHAAFMVHRLDQSNPLGFFNQMTEFKGKLIFDDIRPATGRELFTYDFALDTSYMVADIDPGFGNSSSPTGFTVLNNKLYFSAIEAGTGRELYEWDGITPVKRITDINAGAGSSINYNPGNNAFGIYKNELYFSASASTPGKQSLYKYTPSTGNVTMVYDYEGNSQAYYMATYGKHLFFMADSSSNLKRGMWVYDGNAVRHIEQLFPGTDIGFASYLTEANGHLYFRSGFPSNDIEPYVITDSIALNVEDISLKGRVVVYPNPTSGNVTIMVELKEATKFTLTVTDMQGKIVYSSGLKYYDATKHEVLIPMQHTAAGNYIYSMVDDSGKLIYCGKLVKE